MRRQGNDSYNRRVVFQNVAYDSNFRFAFLNDISQANWSSAKFNYLRKTLKMCEQTIYLMENGFIPNGRMCETCGVEMKLVMETRNQHGCYWRCYNRTSVRKQKKKECRKEAAVTKNSWFDRAKLKKMEVIEFAYRWWHR